MVLWAVACLGWMEDSSPLCSCPEPLGAEEEVLSSQEGAFLGPRSLWSQLPDPVKGLGDGI